MPFRPRDMCYRRIFDHWPEVDFHKVGRFDFPVRKSDICNVSVEQVDINMLNYLAHYKTWIHVYDTSRGRSRYLLEAYVSYFDIDRKIEYKIELYHNGTCYEDNKYINSFYQRALTEDMKWNDLIWLH